VKTGVRRNTGQQGRGNRWERNVTRKQERRSEGERKVERRNKGGREKGKKEKGGGKHEWKKEREKKSAQSNTKEQDSSDENRNRIRRWKGDGKKKDEERKEDE
jgi:hypothetical protein